MDTFMQIWEAIRVPFGWIAVSGAIATILFFLVLVPAWLVWNSR